MGFINAQRKTAPLRFVSATSVLGWRQQAESWFAKHAGIVVRCASTAAEKPKILLNTDVRARRVTRSISARSAAGRPRASRKHSSVHRAHASPCGAAFIARRKKSPRACAARISIPRSVLTVTELALTTRGLPAQELIVTGWSALAKCAGASFWAANCAAIHVGLLKARCALPATKIKRKTKGVFCTCAGSASIMSRRQKVCLSLFGRRARCIWLSTAPIKPGAMTSLLFVC